MAGFTQSDATHLRRGVSLESLTAMSKAIHGVWKDDVEMGDRLVVETRNSTYVLEALGDSVFVVSGGWFDRTPRDAREVRIVGCNWGGSCVDVRLAAAPGLCLEFSNGVVTSPVRRVAVYRTPDTTTN
jgi:hypothetical protein